MKMPKQLSERLSTQLRYEAHSCKGQDSWSPSLEERLSIRAREIALVVAERMRDPTFIHAIAEQVKRQSRSAVGWSPLSLSSGDIGVALMYEYFDQCFPEQGWNTFTRQYLRRATEDAQSIFVMPSLFSGTSGMALMLSLASKGGTRYQKTLAHLHEGLYEQVHQHTWRRHETVGGVADRDYDVISGAAGVLAYLISIENPGEEIQAAVEHLLEYFLWLAEPGQPEGKERWYIPPELLPTDRHREVTPRGHFNCGLAHGIPGPLAALALAWQAGYRYPGLRESIAYLANWIVEHHVNAPWGIDWPDSVPFEYAADPHSWRSLQPTRIAWCYGTPGVARSLWLAAQAIDSEYLRQTAIGAIEAVLSRLGRERHILSSHICHGTAGLLQICLRFAHECESSLVREQIPVLVEQILDSFDPAAALGFCDMDEGKPLDRPAWLTGAPGIAMVLLAASTTIVPRWDRVLVIA